MGSLTTLCLFVYLPLVAVFVTAALQTNVPASVLFRDPNALTDAPFYAGAFSNLGVLLWWSAATAAALTYLLLRKFAARRRAERYFFLAVAAFTGLLALDDLLMLHEVVLPAVFGVPEEAVFGLYALLLVVLLVYFRRLVLRLGFALPFTALTLFAASVLIDVGALRLFTDLPAGLNGYLEDSAKLLGIASWCYYLVRLGVAELAEVLAPRPQPLTVPATQRHTSPAGALLGIRDL